ncbi:fimbrial protein [Citrobacter farmeri]|uniref:fimbrial protein n=1 Tax=Citrobacter farmeri TaxID=67824 RepID=UPI0018A00D8F|nr:fimbrial protein [Citrobacter farmeri]EHK0946552.1 fimbrial protein [Citrobacter farmeri]EKX4542301.1 fimbrial protein [Citrobacter farmeri]MDB2165229.1 fimbrial protein [Citrobacter farmeri]HBC0358986.1 fimbrial protein [Citrobacter farmeri]HBZ8836473.1 fimbrial protein [Citrobacter farmeri]
MFVNMIRILIGGLLFCNAIVGHAASISCYNGSGGGPQTIYVSFGDITVPRDLAVGQVITSGQFGNMIDDAVTCAGDFINSHLANLVTYNNGKPSTGAGGHVYDTNIEGVGIRVRNSSYMDGSGYYDNPAATVMIRDTRSDSVSVNIELIKTGDIKSGTLASGEIGEYYAADSGYNKVALITQIMMQGGGNITQHSCKVTTSGLSFRLPDVNANEFRSTVGYSPPETDTQDLGLECDAGTNISAALSGVKNPDLNDASVLALTGQGNANVAKGVGIQLLYNGQPLKIDQALELKTSAGGVESLPITARYYQTLKKIKNVGKANSSATMVLTYQ